MAEKQDQVDNLLRKLEHLVQRQEVFVKEISELKAELIALKSTSTDEALTTNAPKESKKDPILDVLSKEVVADEENKEVIKTPQANIQQQRIQTARVSARDTANKKLKKWLPTIDFSQGFEKFIGENLLSKLGIISIIIAVAIGAKFSIDNDLISPLTRIILGYGVGIGLLGFGIKLKPKYETFSAVLVSGAIAIFYFLTFFAYDLYQLIPQLMAFGMMVVFTVFTVVAAIHYNKQVIAHIGLIGAYAVPFLLSSQSGQVVILYSYIAIINIGILVIAFRKYWKSLYYSAFFLTWVIFASWFLMEYRATEHFSIGMLFSTIFFLIFYLTFLAYKLLQKEQFSKSDVVMLLLNSFVFYILGYFLMNGQENYRHLVGLFTLINAAVHFIVCVFVYKQDLADKKLFYLLASLVLVFITIAIPVQLRGHWVTLLWAVEAALLFWLGRTKAIPIFENLSYALMLLACYSFIGNYNSYFNYYSVIDSQDTPFLNIGFLSSLLFSVAFGFMTYISQQKKYQLIGKAKTPILEIFSFLIPTFFLFAVYFTFRFEIQMYFDNLFQNSKIESGPSNYIIRKTGSVWILNYSLLFVSILSLLNYKLIKNKQFSWICIGLNVLAVVSFLSLGLEELDSLQYDYLSPSDNYPNPSKMQIYLRYISYPFLALTLFSTYLMTKTTLFNKYLPIGLDLLIHGSILVVASFEVIHLMELAESAQSYKLGLSILWGIYALILIVLGLWKKKQHLRLFAIALFAITLIKLFFYDLTHLNTIAKTVVFLALGILLLLVSFLYAKYKDIITDEVTND